MVATTCEKRPDGFFSVPLNIRCSRKWARPDLPGVSSAEPTLYQIIWVTTGVRRSGMTTTCRPLGRVNVVGRSDVTVVWALARCKASDGTTSNANAEAIRPAVRSLEVMACVDGSQPGYSLIAIGPSLLEQIRWC